MKIHNYLKKETTENPHKIKSTKIYDKDHALIMHLYLEAGEGLKPHITPVDVAFYVLQGKPHILIGKEKIQVNEDDLIESPKDIIHSIYNETDEVVRVLVMKLPKPTEKTKIVE